MIGNVIDCGANEAATLLRELVETPYLISIHFEYDEAADRCPTVRYKIERAIVVEGEG